MASLKRRDLGKPGEAYIREQLNNINVFCSALLDVVVSTPGQVFTLAPADAAVERLLEFEWGGLLSENRVGEGAFVLPDGSKLVPVVSLIDAQIALLRDAMAGVKGAVCIADDAASRWSDPHPYVEATAFGVEDEVYHLLDPTTSDEDFRDAVFGALWHGVSAVCHVPPQLDRARTSTQASLTLCAASAVLITCKAYDGEGFVAWRRTPA